MATAIFGLLGVIIGGVLTASTQYLTERHKTRLAARAAARCLVGELMSAGARITSWTRLGEKPASFDEAGLKAAWDEYKIALNDLPFKQWLHLQGTVLLVRTIATAPSTALDQTQAGQLVEDIQRSIDLLLPHGSSVPRRKLNLSALSEPWPDPVADAKPTDQDNE